MRMYLIIQIYAFTVYKNGSCCFTNKQFRNCRNFQNDIITRFNSQERYRGCTV